MKKPEDFPLDENRKLDPDKVLFIKVSAKSSSDAAVFDLTNAIERNYDGMSAEYIHEVEFLAKDVDATSAVLELKRPKFFRRQTTVTDGSHMEVAQINAPALSFGLVKFSFPQGSSHSSHDIEMKPVSMGRRAEGFAKDSVLYFWDKTENVAVLTKVIGDKRVEIAKFGANHVYDKGGVLAINTAQLDELVAVITCAALLQQLDSFSGPRT